MTSITNRIKNETTEDTSVLTLKYEIFLFKKWDQIQYLLDKFESC
jgi:hypothetical protein